MDTRITATELARNLSDILSRVRYKGETFRVERNGEVVARLEPGPAKRSTVRDFIEFLRTNPPPDEEFANDLTRIRDMQGQLPPDPWES